MFGTVLRGQKVGKLKRTVRFYAGWKGRATGNEKRKDGGNGKQEMENEKLKLQWNSNSNTFGCVYVKNKNSYMEIIYFTLLIHNNFAICQRMYK